MTTRPRLAQWHQSGATDGQIATWDNGLMRWVPADAPGLSLTLDDLTDVDTSSTPPTDGQTLLYDDGASLWVPGDAPAATNGLPTGGTDGQVLTKLSSTDYDADWETPAGGGGGSVTASVRRATGSGMAVNSTTWTDLNTALDLTLAAATGDWVTAEPMGAWSTTGATFGAMDIVTVVAGSPVTSFATGGAPSNTSFGTYAWGGPTSTFAPFGGALRYQLQSGDISGGNVTLRIRVRTDAAIAKSIHCSSVEPFFFSARVN